MCMHVYVCMCMYICMCMCVCVYMCMCIYNSRFGEDRPVIAIGEVEGEGGGRVAKGLLQRLGA